MRVKQKHLLTEILRYGTALLLVIAPFYLTFSIWLYQFVNHLDFIKIWQEILICLIAAVAAVFLVKHWGLAKQFLTNRLVMLMLAYILLIVLIGVYDVLSQRVSSKAVIYGLITDLRPVAIFLLAALAQEASRLEGLRNLSWKRIVFIPAAIVISFGFLQATVLPKDFLSHFGYNAHTTLPYETVDNQPGIVRIQSTLAGPNPLGAYIMLILVLTVGWVSSAKNIKKWWLWIFGFISLVALYKTYSRSAELGLALSLFSLMVMTLKGRQLRTFLRVSSLVVVLALIGGIIALGQHNYTVQNLLLHSSNKTKSSLSSNSQRVMAEKQAVKDIIHQPLGGGIGSAGPASRRNTNAPVRIAENSYLQIGQEAGVLGLALFLAINIGVGYLLWQNRESSLSMSLLASLIGLSLCSLLYHAWADQTLAFIWWGLAGVCLAPILTGRLKQKNAKTH